MAELSVIIILALGAITTAGWTVIRLVRLLPSETEDDRLKRALQSAAEGLAKRQIKLIAASLALEMATALLAMKLLTGAFAWWLALGLLVGTCCVFLLSQVSVGLSIHSASAAARLAGSGDQAIVLSLRCGTSLTAFAGALAVLLGAGALVAVRTTDFAATLGLLEGTVLGGLGAALVLHATGAALRLAGVTSRATSPNAGKLPHYRLDSSNPSLVLDLIAQHTGAAQAHVQRVFWVFCMQQAFALVIAGEDPSLAASLLATTLLTQGVALVSASAIQLGLRASDGVRTWSSVLSQGLLAHGVLCLVAFVGAGFWLLGEALRPTSALFATLGAGLTWATVASTSRGSARHSRRLEDPDVERRPALDLNFGIPAALQSAAIVAAAICFTLGLLAYLTPDASAIAAALWWLTTGALLPLPFLEAQGQLDPLTESAASLASLRVDTGRGEPHAHLGALCAVGQQGGSSSQRAFAVVSCLLALLGMAQLSTRALASPSLLSQALQALAALAISFGALAVLSRRATLTALLGVSEVSRHQRIKGDPASTPGYARFVEELTGRALQGCVWTAVLAVFAIFAAVVAIGYFPGGAPEGSLAAPTTFLAFVAAGGISVTLLGVGIASFVGVTRGFRRVVAGSTSSPISDALNTAHVCLADLTGFVLAPAALVLVHLTLAVVIAATPFVQ